MINFFQSLKLMEKKTLDREKKNRQELYSLAHQEHLGVRAARLDRTRRWTDTPPPAVSPRSYHGLFSGCSEKLNAPPGI